MADNELIAEFMGAKQDQVHAPIGEYMWYGKTHFGIYLYHKNKLLYNTSWDWLMPVVEKIRDIDKGEYGFDDDGSLKWDNVVFSNLATTIDFAYQRVVEFIKWYNSNHPQP